MRFPAFSGADAAQALFGGRSTLVLGLALFATLTLLRAVVVTGVGDHLSADQPQSSLALGDSSPEVLASAALDSWQAKNYARASKLSMAALDRSPLNVHALRTRGLALDSEGQAARAEQVMQFAATRSWRDDGVQGWLLRDEIVKHQFDQAFLHADALARRRQELWPALFLLFEVGAGDDRSARAIMPRLAAQPLWRETFLEALSLSRQKDPAIEKMFELVDRGPTPLEGPELSDYPKRLVREGRFHDALVALQSYRGGRALTGSPFDGGFTDKTGAPPFAWQKLDKPGASLDMDSAPGRPGASALRVEYDAYSADDLMRQALAPSPGDYLLSGEVFPEEGDARLIGWQVRCAGDRRILATGGADASAAPNIWRRFAARFSVPAQGCDGVWLVLTETRQDHGSSNTVWFTNLAIQPAAPAAAAK